MFFDFEVLPVLILIKHVLTCTYIYSNLFVIKEKYFENLKKCISSKSENYVLINVGRISSIWHISHQL